MYAFCGVLIRVALLALDYVDPRCQLGMSAADPGRGAPNTTTTSSEALRERGCGGIMPSAQVFREGQASNKTQTYTAQFM